MSASPVHENPVVVKVVPSKVKFASPFRVVAAEYVAILSFTPLAVAVIAAAEPLAAEVSLP